VRVYERVNSLPAFPLHRGTVSRPGAAGQPHIWRNFGETHPSPGEKRKMAVMDLHTAERIASVTAIADCIALLERESSGRVTV